jgi:hypothetical protein
MLRCHPCLRHSNQRVAKSMFDVSAARTLRTRTARPACMYA